MSTSKRPSLSLYLGTPFKEELTDYCFILKVTRVFPYSYTGKVDQRMVNTLLMIKINPTCKRLLIFICQEKTETWLASPVRDRTLNMQEGRRRVFVGAMKYFRHILMDHEIFFKIFDVPQNIFLFSTFIILWK